MDGQFRSKPKSQSADIQPTSVPIRLIVGGCFLVFGLILYLFTN